MDGPYREALDGWPWQCPRQTRLAGTLFQPGKNPVDLRLELQVSEGGWEELKRVPEDLANPAHCFIIPHPPISSSFGDLCSSKVCELPLTPGRGYWYFIG